MNKEKKKRVIFLQCCDVCETVQAAYINDENEYYPVTEEWMDECFIGKNARDFQNDENITIEWIGPCCVECDIEKNGWYV